VGYRERNVLKSLTDNFVFPSEALLKISRSLSNRSGSQLYPLLLLVIDTKEEINLDILRISRMTHPC